VLYHLLTGQAPDCGATTAEIRAQIQCGPPPPILTVNPHAHQGLARITETAMARDQGDRYANMEQVLANLRRVVAGKPPAGRGAIRRTASLRVTVIVVLVGVLALAGLASLVLPPQDRIVFEDDFRGAQLDARRHAHGRSRAVCAANGLGPLRAGSPR
jgi:hypothetical protein